MNHFRKVGQLFIRTLLFPVRDIAIPIARFVHLGVTLNAQDDAFWTGVCYLLLVKSIIWLTQLYVDRGW